jgi:hypothetical protein
MFTVFGKTTAVMEATLNQLLSRQEKYYNYKD